MKILLIKGRKTFCLKHAKKEKKAQVLMFVHDLISCIYLFIVITTRSMSYFAPFFNFPNLFYRIFYHLLVTFFFIFLQCRN